ncbi:hypothetical protein J4E83_003885 [Alternaria metachromatica]|uniref:uncharacterized protein n=1 Tax=Alternaria metachromatica TaxID=283354 RepID=UPI0020C1C285|nr:uncharacterized protein J4E83_003885 [Alternaria metachromatica]KAI4626733.1 hypothetical protein J4E83_003885 [Alternaria metachromatica]
MSYAEANRRYFDAISDSYDSKPWFKVVNDRVATTLRSDLSWVGIPFTDSTTQPVRLLDYACGTGLMTRVFGPYVTSTQGIDISPNMVSTYNTRARDAGISEDVVNAVVGHLFDKSDPNPEALSGERFWDFDIATNKHDVGESNPEFRQKMNASIVVPHFTIDGVKQFFAEAGFVDVDVITMKEKNYMEFGGKKLWRTILFARGRRPMEGQDGPGKSEL